jgi:hypothetical protein
MGQRICAAKYAKVLELHLWLAGCPWVASFHCLFSIYVRLTHPGDGINTRLHLQSHRMVR